VATIAGLDDSGDPQVCLGLLIETEELERWAGRKLTGAEIERLAACVPFSSIPEAIQTIVDSWEEPQHHVEIAASRVL
jgi:hypothetical protein